MIPLDQAVVARLESHGERFEVLVDPNQAMRIRQGEEIDLEDVVAADSIFSNAAHAERASEEALLKVFEDEYQEDADFAGAIGLGIKALHAATEGKLDVGAIEIGLVSIETREFRKLERDEVKTYVDQFEE